MLCFVTFISDHLFDVLSDYPRYHSKTFSPLLHSVFKGAVLVVLVDPILVSVQFFLFSYNSLRYYLQYNTLLLFMHSVFSFQSINVLSLHSFIFIKCFQSTIILIEVSNLLLLSMLPSVFRFLGLFP